MVRTYGWRLHAFALLSNHKHLFAETPEPNPQSGIVLTDDYNPVEFYDAANREHMRRMLADSMRR